MLNFEQKINYIRTFRGHTDFSNLRIILNDESQPYQILYETIEILKNYDTDFLEKYFKTSLARIDEILIYYGLAKYLKSILLIELSLAELIQVKIKLCCLILSLKTDNWKIVNDSLSNLFSVSRNLRASAIETISNVVDSSEFSKLNIYIEKLLASDIDDVDGAELKEVLLTLFSQNKWFTGIVVYYLKKENIKLDAGQLKMIDELKNNTDLCIREAFNYYNSLLEKDQFPVFEEMILLRNVSIFKELDSHGLKLLGIMADEVFVKSGSKIFLEGDIGDALYVIASGKVRIYKENNENIAVLSNNQYFGEFAVLSNEKRLASALATEDTLLIRITKEKFMALLQKYPVIIFPIFQNLIGKIISKKT